MTMPGGQNRESMGQSMGQSMGKMASSQISMYLKNIDFPADKQKILDMAKSHGAPENVIQMLNRIPDKQYSHATEIEQEFSKMM